VSARPNTSPAAPRSGALPAEARVCAAACGLGRIGVRFAAAIAALRGEPCLLVASGGCAATLAAQAKGEPHLVPQGRPLPYALGLALARPGRRVLAFLGDGEAAGPGLGHLLHAARRGDPVRAIVVNNEVLGGAGGFPSGATPRGRRTEATPEGSAGRGVDLARLALEAGAAWVGRETVSAGTALDRLFEEFLEAPVFSLLEVLAPCYPAVGRWNGHESPEAMHAALERRAIRQGGADARPEDDRFPVGRLWPADPSRAVAAREGNGR
jgi:2-oxoglutarate ferredoxin oxidoreductase subunit beta